MAQVSKVPVSRLIQKTEDDEPKSRSREEFKKLKELEEMRKLGTAPAAVDEEGKDINPHIPMYISDAPWYVDPTGPTLKHQRPQEERQRQFSSMQEWYKKGIDPTRVATKYRKNACENCGGMGHKKKDCLEKPRKVGAKYSGANFAPDDHVNPELKFDFDGKRDRWNGYDPTWHKDVVEEFHKVEEMKKELKKEKLKAGYGNPEEDDGADSSDDDEDKYVDKMDMPGTKVDATERSTVRNLRIREDTAKYLRNLDPNSAYYDPKTRSMRKNPYEGTGRTEDEVDYAGDNYVRISGDTVTHAQSQLFAWDAGRKGLDVHALAEPTKLEVLKKEYSAKKNEFKDEAKNSILEKYGGVEHLEAPPRELIFAQTEEYVEYSRHGKILKGEETPIIRSRYEEDVYINNHTSVWGSYWSEGKWGFKCCYSFVKNSYCCGAAGKEANDTTLTLSAAKSEEKEKEKEKETSDSSEAEERKAKQKAHDEKQRKKREKKKKKKSKKKKKRRESSSSSSDSEDEDEKREKKIQEAMKKLSEEEKKADELLSMDERKRKYNSMKVNDIKAPTEEEMEAYYRKRKRAEDPMAEFL